MNAVLVVVVVAVLAAAFTSTLLIGFSFLCWKLDQLKIERAEKYESRRSHHGAGYRSGSR